MERSNDKEIIVIAGPTASGKTALSVDLAIALDTFILSADSRQCFREMNIGVAKPSKDEMKNVPHFFIHSHSIHENINAGFYENYALSLLDQHFRDKNQIIVVGGTGLYIKALCEGLDTVPAGDKNIREKIIHQYEYNGLNWLQNEIAIKDPHYWNQTAEKENPQRLMRALEVIESSGHSILDFHLNEEKKRPFHIRKFAIEWPRETLYERINQRVEIMMKNGLVEEVKNLLPYQHLNALKTVGYAEIFDFLADKTDLKTAIEKIKTNTRHYAKRQMTWFRKDPTIEWIKPQQFPDFIERFSK